MLSDREGGMRRLSSLEDERRLRADALAELDSVGGVNYQVPPYEEAGDSTNTVRVAVDRDGNVVDVHVRSDWHTVLNSAELGAALLAAHRNASAAIMNAVALGELAKDERAKAGRDRRPSEPEPVPEVPPLDIWQIWQRLSDVEETMYRAAKLSRDGAGGEPRTLHSRFGLLTATCEGGLITNISVEPRLVQRAGTEQLRSAAMELFRDAGQPIGRDHR